MTGAVRATQVEHLNRLRSGNTRITIMLDNDVLEDLRARAEEQGTGYQTAINLALRQYLKGVPSMRKRCGACCVKSCTRRNYRDEHPDQ